MKKTFCSNCGEEITVESKNLLHAKLKGSWGAVKYEISAGINGIDNDDLCHECVYGAVAANDPRPKEAPKETTQKSG